MIANAHDVLFRCVMAVDYCSEIPKHLQEQLREEMVAGFVASTREAETHALNGRMARLTAALNDQFKTGVKPTPAESHYLPSPEVVASVRSKKTNR